MMPSSALLAGLFEGGGVVGPDVGGRGMLAAYVMKEATDVEDATRDVARSATSAVLFHKQQREFICLRRGANNCNERTYECWRETTETIQET
mmetsp:Transcript_23178/g.71244  ORF Transcript_23178/g.71244 Transcript_23178/m.71244 type:complete len:92 (-) Transcript_23178:161-436(-)